MTVQPQAAYPAPPDPPERPLGAVSEPRWPWWYGPLAILAGAVATAIVTVLLGLILGATGSVDPNSPSPGPVLTLVGTLIFDAIFVGAAVLFASITRRPEPWHFGFRRTRLWPAVGWAAAGAGVFVLFTIVYGVLVQPDAEQTVTQDLGLRKGGLLLLLGGILVVVVAPIAEEVFFRGFIYKALRTSLPVVPAALIDGVLFGLIHFTGPGSLEVLPVLAVLGVVFCLVYELTGSLYPAIALHALNNALAFGIQTGTGEAWIVGAAIGAAAIAGCMLLPRYAWRTAPAAR